MAGRVLIHIGLQLQLLAARIGRLPLAAMVLLILAATGYFAGLPKLHEATEANRLAQAALHEPSVETGAPSLLTVRYEEFRNRLGALDERGDHLKALFAAAAQAGVTLSQGDYRMQIDADCDCLALQVTLPIRGTYPQIRAFIDTALEKIPPLALDEISFRRDNVKASAVDARLRLTLYLKEGD